MIRDVPDVDELYSQAAEVDNFHRDNWRNEDLEWGENPGEYEASNFFVWDVQPNRFNGSTEVPNEIVVLPEVYEAFAEGDAFLVSTPLYDEEDFDDAKKVLGDQNIVGNENGGFRGVEELDTPKDIMQMHQLGERLGKDVYTPSEWDYMLSAPDESGPEILDEWRQTAYNGLDNFVNTYTSKATGRWAEEVIGEFAENGNNTAIVTYATRNDGYSEDVLEVINQQNDGGLSYHTPFTLNQILGRNILGAD
jgi:hypothetical protein